MSLIDLQNLISTQPLHWYQPLWLLLALQPLLLLVIRRLLHKQHLDDYADRNLQPWVVVPAQHSPVKALFSRHTAWVITWILLAVSAAGPRLATSTDGTNNSTTMDIIFVVDVSRSMRVSDVMPDRIRRARIEIEEFLQSDNVSHNNRMSIIVYTARPHLFSALTNDRNAFRFYLEQLDSLILPGYGSQPQHALQLAQKELQASVNRRAIFWMTDGDFSSSDSRSLNQLQQRIEKLQPDNIALSIMGIGTKEGEAIQLPGGQWLSHKDQSVVSRMDEEKLQALSLKASGSYSRVKDDSSDWQTLYFDGIARGLTEPAEDIDESKVVWLELFTWTLLPGLFFLFIASTPYKLSFNSRHNSRNNLQNDIQGKAINSSQAVNIMLVCLTFTALISLFAAPDIAAAESNTISSNTGVQAFEHFKSGDFRSANNNYARIKGYRGRLGEGAGHYRMRDYSNAILQFSQAALEADTDAQRAAALYNLGNSYFQAGQYAISTEVFKDALLYQPNHLEALHNLTVSVKFKKLVEKRIRQTAGPASRAGRGPRTANLDRSISLGQSGAMPDLSDNPAIDNTGLVETPDDENIEALIQKGLQHIRLASGDPSRPGETFTFIWQPQDTSITASSISEDRGKLWKRLFEIEEGLDAPATEPKTVPGINPW